MSKRRSKGERPVCPDLGKQCYASLAIAGEAAREHEAKFNSGAMSAYYCYICRHYHIGHEEKKRKVMEELAPNKPHPNGTLPMFPEGLHDEWCPCQRCCLVRRAWDVKTHKRKALEEG